MAWASKWTFISRSARNRHKAWKASNKSSSVDFLNSLFVLRKKTATRFCGPLTYKNFCINTQSGSSLCCGMCLSLQFQSLNLLFVLCCFSLFSNVIKPAPKLLPLDCRKLKKTFAAEHSDPRKSRGIRFYVRPKRRRFIYFDLLKRKESLQLSS